MWFYFAQVNLLWSLLDGFRLDNLLAVKKRVNCFTLIVLWLSIFVSVPHGAMSRAAACDWGPNGHT